MDWKNFKKEKPKENGMFCVIISGVGIPKNTCEMCIWNGNFFQNTSTKVMYPVSYASGEGVYYSAAVEWYLRIKFPPDSSANHENATVK